MNKKKNQIWRIKICRKKLEELFLEQNMKVDEKILHLSQELDGLIVDYYQ